MDVTVHGGVTLANQSLSAPFTLISRLCHTATIIRIAGTIECLAPLTKRSLFVKTKQLLITASIFELILDSSTDHDRLEYDT